MLVKEEIKVMQHNYSFVHANIVRSEELIRNGYVHISNGKIEEIGDMKFYEKRNDYDEIHLTEDELLLPGFIDIHIHGINGADMMDATEQSLYDIATKLPHEGTTSFLATTITHKQENIELALTNAAKYTACQNFKQGSEMLGIHLEGPFLSKKRAGAQPLQHIIPSTISLFNQWQQLSGNLIKVVTLAPELENGLELTKYLSEHKVIPSIGHSDAIYDEVKKAIELGAKHVTHFYNGMRGIHHREPGVVGAGLAHDNLFLELIVDGIHVHPAVIKSTYKTKGSEKIILITDSMRAKWLEDGEYELGGQKVIVRNNTALLEDGTLAGSVLKMNDAVKNMMQYTGCTINEAIQMAAENPAKQLSVWDRKGSITTGKDADIVIVKDDLTVQMTMCNGIIEYKGVK